jgi:hypothetical protein
VIEELYIRTLCRKPTATEVARLAAIVQREVNDPKRIEEMARLQLSVDPAFKRKEERLRKLKADLAALPKPSKQAASLEKQIGLLEKEKTATLLRFQADATRMVYGDILWGLFNSTEFTFNH